MSRQKDRRRAALQYQARASKPGYREITRAMQCRTKYRTLSSIRHGQAPANTGRSTKAIRRLRNANIADWQRNDPAFVPITRTAHRLKRGPDCLARTRARAHVRFLKWARLGLGWPTLDVGILTNG